jgi:tagatose 1,6-diphosphate aldolase
MQATAFQFLDVPRLFTLVDHELELVEPDLRYVDELLAACHHPLTRQFMPAQARTTRENILSFVSQNPRGWTTADPSRGISSGYTFWMRIRPQFWAVPLPSNGNGRAAGVRPVTTFAEPEIKIAGSISLRVGHSVNLDRYLGHIGYHVLPPARGRHFAERAARLLLPLARAHGHRLLWITCNPDNTASRRTCERLPSTFVDIVPVPRDNPLYSQGDRQKCRFRVDL